MLNAAQLNEIEQEVRHCFIHEDAPEYLQGLEHGILTLTALDESSAMANESWREVLRAAHTLKGGAGLAQLYGLSKLSHRLEDLLVALQEHLVNPEAIADAHSLLMQGMDGVRSLLGQAAQGSQDPDSPIPNLLEQFLATHLVASNPDAPQVDSEGADADEFGGMGDGMDAIQMVLQLDLGPRLQEAIAALPSLNDAEQRAMATDLAENALVLGEVLQLAWLQEAATQLQATLAGDDATVEGRAAGDWAAGACSPEGFAQWLQAMERDRTQTLAGRSPQTFGAGTSTALSVPETDPETSP
jgi:chemotaxis protein histidine kinase CheA